MPYSKMKNGVEDVVRELGFENGAVVVKPGMILGEREGGEHKSWILETVLGNLHWVSGGLQDALGMLLFFFSLHFIYFFSFLSPFFSLSDQSVLSPLCAFLRTLN